MHIPGNDKVERFRTARELMQTAQRLGVMKLREQASAWYPLWADEVKELSKARILEELQNKLTADAQ